MQHRRMLALVIFMTLLLIAGIALVAYGFIKNWPA